MGCKNSSQFNNVQQDNCCMNGDVTKQQDSSRLQFKSFAFSRKLPGSVAPFVGNQQNRWEHSVTSGVHVTSKSIVSGVTDSQEFANFSYEKDLEILEFLGKGGYGKVYKAWHKRLKKYVALKFFRLRGDAPGNKSDQQMAVEVQIECAIMKKLEEAGVTSAIKFYMVYEEERKLMEEENENNLDQNGEKSLVIMMESGECSMGELLKVREKYPVKQLIHIV